MTRPQHNFTSLSEYFSFLSTAVGYLEKASSDDLGDFTAAGKTRNAGYKNYTVYWKWYNELGYGNYQGSAYCAASISTMMANAFGLEKAKQLLCGNLFIYCPTGYQRFANKKQIVTTPQPGDIVFYYSSSMGRYSHVAQVIAVDADGKGYTTWEGNTGSGNNTVIRNGGATLNKHYTLGSKKEAFGRPDWAAAGISTDGTGVTASSSLETFDIATGAAGLVCTTSTLNVRNYPSTGTVAGSIKKGEAIKPTKKTFVNGEPWYYVDGSGWCSAKYFTGWVQEKSHDDKWWYLLPGYDCYTDKIATIGNERYFFGSDGYMFTGELNIKTNNDGAIVEEKMS